MENISDIVSNAYKKFHLVNLETLWWLSQWFFEKQYNNITGRYSENNHAVENESSKPSLVKGFVVYL